MYVLVYNLSQMNQQDILNALNWRYATKSYDTSKKLEEDKLHTILEAGRLAPSSVGSQPWKFIVISNPELKAKLAPHAYNQPQVTESSHLIVLCAITEFDEKYIDSHIDLTASTKGISAEMLAGYKNMLMGMTSSTANWLKHQVFIPLGMMMLAAAELHVDASPIGGFNPAGIDEALGLTEKGLTSVVLLGVGYRNENDTAASQPKVRWPEDKVIIRMD